MKTFGDDVLVLEADRDRATKPLRLPAGVGGPQHGDKAMALLSVQPKPADAVWTQTEWTELCRHLHNGNGPLHFVMGFRDEHGVKQYRRSKRVPVDRAISWAWKSIISTTAKKKLAFVPYSTDERQKSRWGGLDFDCHDGGDADRARELAFAAFRVLLNVPEVCVILETSGSGGWHVWGISQEFHDTQEWIRLLKDVARLIGVPIAPGLCEIFPPDSLPSRFGKGMRAPGCWNPSTETCSQIVWENTRSFHAQFLSGNSTTIDSQGVASCEFLDKRNKLISCSPPPGLAYREKDFLQRYSITSSGTRNDKLAGLVGEVFNQVGHSIAHRLAQAQFRNKNVVTKAREAEHMASFEKLWSGLAEKWNTGLASAEREIHRRLETEHERDAFRIVRSFARKAHQDGAKDFPIVRDNVAERLGITGPGLAKIRDKLVRLGAIEKTQDYKANKLAARFRWLLNEVEPKAPCDDEPF